MANQGFTTGSQGVLLMAPVKITDGVASIATPKSIASINSVLDFKYDVTDFLELAIFCSKPDEVGIVTSTPVSSGTPRQATFTIDRDDNYSFRFLQRYCTSLRSEYESPVSASTNAKEYEDGITVRGDDAETETIKPTDTIFFVHLGPKFKDEAGGTKITYGLAGIGSDSASYTTAFEQDNQFTFTLIGAPQDKPSDVLDIKDFVFNSVVGVKFGTVGGPNGVQYLPSDHLDGLIWKHITDAIGDYEFVIPAKTSILQDIIIKPILP